MEVVNALGLYSIPVVQLATWFAAGLAAGSLLGGRRPVGLFGDLIVGVLGGFLGGWAADKTGIRLSDLFEGVMSQRLAGVVGEFLTALVGALIVLVILRIAIRRPG
jgi:uncharacterized membrane protein YeaQ/YmgE (transglycosylase-associated protein family)